MHGRDENFRPIIVLRLYKFEVSEQKITEYIEVFKYFFEWILANMMIPGQVENWIIFLDLNNMSVLNLPLKVRSQSKREKMSGRNRD